MTYLWRSHKGTGMREDAAIVDAIIDLGDNLEVKLPNSLSPEALASGLFPTPHPSPRQRVGDHIIARLCAHRAMAARHHHHELATVIDRIGHRRRLAAGRQTGLP